MDVAQRVGGLPPVGSLFASFLGYNPVQNLVGDQVLAKLPPSDARTLTGKTFFPQLISGPFHHGLVIVFAMAVVMTLIAAGASMLRGGRYVHGDTPATAEAAATLESVPAGAQEAGAVVATGSDVPATS
jgi:hypothetical protein